jgi:hypothetical protein
VYQTELYPLVCEGLHKTLLPSRQVTVLDTSPTGNNDTHAEETPHEHFSMQEVDNAATIPQTSWSSPSTVHRTVDKGEKDEARL